MLYKKVISKPVINFLSSEFLFLSLQHVFFTSLRLFDEIFRLNVIKGFELIDGDLEDEAEEFLDYFKKTWVGEPKKPVKLKSCYLYVLLTAILGCEKKETIRLTTRSGIFMIAPSPIFLGRTTPKKVGLLYILFVNKMIYSLLMN